MTRYRPVMIDGVAGFSLRRGANTPPPGSPPPARAETARPAAGSDPVARAKAGLTRRVIGEPDPATATLADWRAWRAGLLTLPRDDPADDSVRVALAIAEAQIARLRERLR